MSAGAEVVPIKSPQERLRSRSYASAVLILGENRLDILNGRTLELNEMTGRIELGRQPVTDVTISRLRYDIERCFVGGEDREGRPTGLQLSPTDVYAAVEHVASEKTYHPVRAYLGGLVNKWDGIERIAHVAEDILDAAPSPLNEAIMRRFFVSCVLRAYKPGCKVDTVLVLVGKQGARKSTFFRELGKPWHVDTAIDIHNKDSYQQLRRAWIFEWGELESLRRARDIAAAKAFLSSQIDTYRQPYGRFVVDVPRSCVIVGTTNVEEFLVDEENRRFWPIRTGPRIDIDRLIACRDQYWAEALELSLRNEQHWLEDGESELLVAEQSHYLTKDPWESIIMDWIATKKLSVTLVSDPEITFTTTDVLTEAIKKPAHMLMRADEMRVAAILKAHEIPRRRPSNNEPRMWYIKTR